MTITTTTDKIVGLLKNKNAMINKPTAAIAYTYNLRLRHLNLTHHIFMFRSTQGHTPSNGRVGPGLSWG